MSLVSNLKSVGTAAYAALSVGRRAAPALLAAAWLLLGNVAAWSAAVPVPPLRGPVTDLTATLTREQITALEGRLKQFEAAKGSQIAILLVPTTMPETIEQYSIRVAESWQLGRKGVDDGVLVLLAKQDRAVRIEVGYGLEGALPDVLANRITDQVMVPRFAQGDFFGGLWQGLERIIAVIEGEALPDAASREPAPDGLGQSLPLLLVLVLVGGGILRRLLGALGGASATAVLAGGVAWMLSHALAIAVGAAVVAFLFALFSGAASRHGWSSARRGSWGGSSWGGGFGGGGGGWGGGGGGFGGGGASGRW